MKTILHEMSNPFFFGGGGGVCVCVGGGGGVGGGENIINLSSAEFAQRVVKIKEPFPQI